MSEEVKQEGEFKVASKRKSPSFKKKRENDEVYKVDLTPKEDAVQEQQTEESVSSSSEKSKEAGEETKVGLQEVGETHEESKEDEEVTVIGENKTEETKVDNTKYEEELKALPDNIQKLVSFMEETGGSVEDYVRLNSDYSNVDELSLLKEYYKTTKPHLNNDEVEFLIADEFSYLDDEEDKVKKKKDLARKEEIAKARNFLDGLKDKYYDEIKLNSNVNPEYQKAMDFFNRYNEQQEAVTAQHDEFVNNTNKFFTNEFKGFDFKVGEKKFKYNISNPNRTAEAQSDLQNFIGKFLNEDGSVNDLASYHKALYAANNIDTIAEHFYEQGKADAVKDITAKSNNINDNPRPTPSGDIFVNGLKVKAIDGVDSSRLRFRKNKK